TVSRIAILALLLGSQDPAPVPDAAALKEAEKAVKELFKTEFAAKNASDRVTLAKKLLAQSETSKDDPATRYILLKEAGNAAATGGDLKLALSAADQTGKAFKIDVVALKSDLLQTAAKGAKSPEEFNLLASA